MNKLPSIYKFPTWEEAMNHIRDHHAPASLEIMRDPNQAPIMWHEFHHLSGGSDHDHEETDQAAVEARMQAVMELLKDPDKMKDLIDQVPDAKERVEDYYKDV